MKSFCIFKRVKGPLRIRDMAQTDDDLFAPLATVEPTLVASCSRGCKAFHRCGGIQFHVLDERMSRAPVFFFSSQRRSCADRHLRAGTRGAVRGRRRKHESLRAPPKAHAIRYRLDCPRQVRLLVRRRGRAEHDHDRDPGGMRSVFGDGCGDADGSCATLSSKATWLRTRRPRGCEEVLGCSSERLYTVWLSMEGGPSAQRAVWKQRRRCHVHCMWAGRRKRGRGLLEPPDHGVQRRDKGPQAIGVVGGGTGYAVQKASLELPKCHGPGMKRRLAGLTAAFALALDVGTCAAMASGTFTGKPRAARQGGRLSASPRL